jgi:hypothetical protein
MSKRSRDGGLLVSNKKHCPLHTLKRPCDFDVRQTSIKRSRPTTIAVVSHKRSAEFDCEVDRIHKRLKASIPTAEEAMAFLLPHLLTLRRMYLDVVQSRATLQENNQIITKAYHELVQTSSNEIVALRRQLELSHYRLVMMNRPHCQ